MSRVRAAGMAPLNRAVPGRLSLRRRRGICRASTDGQPRQDMQLWEGHVHPTHFATRQQFSGRAEPLVCAEAVTVASEASGVAKLSSASCANLAKASSSSAGSSASVPLSSISFLFLSPRCCVPAPPGSTPSSTPSPLRASFASENEPRRSTLALLGLPVLLLPVAESRSSSDTPKGFEKKRPVSGRYVTTSASSSESIASQATAPDAKKPGPPLRLQSMHSIKSAGKREIPKRIQ
eukprot:scaffold279_cov229-Pinguiococcus_pyrenoidosus.AAC.22